MKKTIVLSIVLIAGVSFIVGSSIIFLGKGNVSAAQKNGTIIETRSEKLNMQNGDYVEGEVLVKFKKDKVNLQNQQDDYKLASFYRDNKIEEEKKIERQNITLIKSGDKTTVELINDLKNNASVEFVEPNYIGYLSSTPNDTNYNNLWGLHNTGQTVNSTAGTSDADMDAPEAWNLNTGSASVTVAVLDSGIATNHPDLSANLVAGYDFIDSDSTPEDVNSHGTHVAGIIGAVGNNSTGVSGINWNVKIMPLKISGEAGTISSSNLITALNYAVANGAKIVNMSLGFSSYSAAQYSALSDAQDAGVLVVAAAGNDSTNNDSGTHSYPSDYDLDNIISVAATDQNDNLASFSNYGITSVDVAAPGVNIYSTIPYNGFLETFEGATKPGFTGTSFTSSGSNDYWMTYGIADVNAWSNSTSYPLLHGACPPRYHRSPIPKV